MSHPSITLIVASRFENVSLIGAAVNGICRTLLANTYAYQMELCIVEACNNIVEHGFKHDGSHQFTLTLTFLNDRITIVLEYDGQPFVPSGEGDLAFDPDNLDTLPEGGMGLYFIKQLMSSVEYNHRKGMNVITMTKLIPQDEPSQIAS
jgi:serine/threonine-protein kinase RsbW